MSEKGRMGDARIPQIGTVLHHAEQTATIVAGGVQYDGTVYPSLSAAANVAYASRGAKGLRSGYEYWGLPTKPHAAKPAPAKAKARKPVKAKSRKPVKAKSAERKAAQAAWVRAKRAAAKAGKSAKANGHDA